MSTTVTQRQETTRRLDCIEFGRIALIEAGTLRPNSSLHVGVSVGDDFGMRYIGIDPTGDGLVVHTDIEGTDRRIPMRDGYVTSESREILAAAARLRDIVNRTGSENAESVAVAREVVERVVRKLRRYHRP